MFCASNGKIVFVIDSFFMTASSNTDEYILISALGAAAFAATRFDLRRVVDKKQKSCKVDQYAMYRYRCWQLNELNGWKAEFDPGVFDCIYPSIVFTSFTFNTFVSQMIMPAAPWPSAKFPKFPLFSQSFCVRCALALRSCWSCLPIRIG
jgi:hypothetical protein